MIKNIIDTDNNDSNDTHNVKDALINNLINNYQLSLANTIYNLTPKKSLNIYGNKPTPK